MSELDVSPDEFWSDGGETLLDVDAVLKLVANAHAEADFEILWERCDPELDVPAILGRMITVTQFDKARDPMLDRSWFHDMYMDLARLDGELDMDLSSISMLKKAVWAYWQCMKRFIVALKDQMTLVADADVVDAEQETTPTEEELPVRGQLSLF